MKINRRKFLTLTGAAAALGLTSIKGLELIAANTAHKLNPTNNKRLAMVVDMRVFDRYPFLMDKCIEVCNKIHNIPEITNPNHEVKWIWKESYEHAFIEQENYMLPEKIQKKPVLLFCNNCDNPPCTNVCPTKATWKRDEDGVVMMDWHRCIGCRYCMAACPYGSRSFNWSDPRKNLEEINKKYPTRMKGVVEKCTFCDERLVRGQLPACVEAIGDTKALVFGDLNDDKSIVRKMLAQNFSIRRKPELGTQPEVYYIIK